MSWSETGQDDAYKVIFVVGDAPAHMDYKDDVKFSESILLAKQKGILVNTIQCGNDRNTLAQWQSMASLGQGAFFKVAQNGGAVAIKTPYDEQMANLSKDLDGTRLYYGSAELREKKKRKVAATKKMHSGASFASRARRAMFNESKSGKTNAIGGNELVDDISAGRVDLSKMDVKKLPKPMQSMSLEQQKMLVSENAQKRSTLKKNIRALAEKRSVYIKKEMTRRGGAKDSLDNKLIGTLRNQAKAKGLDYGGSTITY